LTGDIEPLGDTGLYFTEFEINDGAWTNCMR
jgi:hypothetical protein